MYDMNKKKALVLCTGNSCRSIMAEALINAKLGDCVEAQSSGVKASGKVNPSAQALLERKGVWRPEYHSKTIDTVLDTPFDLVITVCDNARETCPVFPKAVKTIHVGFEDPSGKVEAEYEKTYELIEKELLPTVKQELCNTGINMQKNVSKTNNGVKINFTGGVQKQNIVQMVQNCATGQCECMSDETKAKVKDMQVEGNDGNVELKLEGEVSVEEIEAALSRSKVLNK